MNTFLIRTNKKSLNIDLTAKSHMFEFFFKLPDGRFLVNTVLNENDLNKNFHIVSASKVKVLHNLNFILDKISRCGIEMLTGAEIKFLNNYGQ